jgi:hypothetical protein
MEEEARELLTGALSQAPTAEPNLYQSIRKVIEPLGGHEPSKD